MPDSPPILSYAPKPIHTIWARRFLLGWEIVNWLAAALCVVLSYAFLFFSFVPINPPRFLAMAVLFVAVAAVFIFYASQCHSCRNRIAQNDRHGARQAIALTWAVEAVVISLAIGIAGYGLYRIAHAPGGLDSFLPCALGLIPITILAILLGITLFVLSQTARSLEQNPATPVPNPPSPADDSSSSPSP